MYMIENTFQKLKVFVFRLIKKRSAIGMWEKRAKRYGTRAVLNIGHSDENVGDVTRVQREKIFPFLQQELTGHEETILDFGCGPGRFTLDLAKLIDGTAIGVDPIQHFLDMAPKQDGVEYRLMGESIIPVVDKSIDVVWICLVLGGIIDQCVLRKTVFEVERVLNDEGFVVLIENTTDIKDTEYWKFRSVEFYQSLFFFTKLKHLSDYCDLSERVSIMIGRKDV